ncbi:MAG: DUF1302 domain-containing protein [Proteobacteria bacterium]|nr:DUF1302 domain-containing protein [Pseudomonadota bacterium]
MTNNLYRLLLASLFLVGISSNAFAWKSKDGKWVAHGYIENSSHGRNHTGVSRSRSRGQLEWSRSIGTVGIFRNVSMHGTLRGSYDAAYELNDNNFGDNAGGPVRLQQQFFPAGVPGFGGPLAAGFTAGSVAWGGGLALFNSGGIGGAANPNDGLALLGADLHGGTGTGVGLAYPVRPCDTDSRGCIDGYMDADKQELISPEFNDRADVIREAYIDATIPLNGGKEINFRVGRQQVVWGRTDLFRVLDIVNPVDFSAQNIYEELEDARIPMGILNMEYRAGGGKTFEDLNFQLLWKFEQARPHTLGQGGSTYSILQAGNFFRAMGTCWQVGCTVGNFAVGAGATDFGPGQIGIRRANTPDWDIEDNDIGARVEGVYKGVGFSLNTMYYNSHLPSLRGGITSTDAFTGATGVFPHALAFDIDFPRIFMFGGSADFYVEKIKSAFRIEAAWTTGEEFADTSTSRLFDDSDVMRYVIGWDRPTFIPFLNKNRAFLLSGQLFGQHILNHNLTTGPTGLNVGMVDWKDNWIGTFLIQGFYKNDTVLPRVITAYDVRAQAGTVAPQVEWLVSNNWKITFGANLKFGHGARMFDDNRSAVPYGTLAALTPAPGVGGSTGLGGFEPLGRFRSGPIGMAQAEDEVQISLRYRF